MTSIILAHGFGRFGSWPLVLLLTALSQNVMVAACGGHKQVRQSPSQPPLPKFPLPAKPIDYRWELPVPAVSTVTAMCLSSWLEDFQRAREAAPWLNRRLQFSFSSIYGNAGWVWWPSVVPALVASRASWLAVLLLVYFLCVFVCVSLFLTVSLEYLLLPSPPPFSTLLPVNPSPPAFFSAASGRGEGCSATSCGRP